MFNDVSTPARLDTLTLDRLLDALLPELLDATTAAAAHARVVTLFGAAPWSGRRHDAAHELSMLAEHLHQRGARAEAERLDALAEALSGPRRSIVGAPIDAADGVVTLLGGAPDLDAERRTRAAVRRRPQVGRRADERLANAHEAPRASDEAIGLDESGLGESGLGESGFGDAPTLADLLAPVDLATFARDHYGRAPLHVARQGEPDRFSHLLSIAEIEARWPDGFRSPTLGKTIVRAGELRASPAGRYPWAEPGGSSLVLVRLDSEPGLPVRPLIQAIEGELGCLVTGNAYLTPRGGQAFEIHWDHDDTLILQLEGSKTWEILPPSVEEPVEGQYLEHLAQMRTEPPRVLTLRAGDTLYIPRGWLHRARATNEDSLHLTIGIHAPQWSTVLLGIARAAVARVETTFAARDRLPPRVSADQLVARRSTLIALVRALGDELAKINAYEAFVDELHLKFLGRELAVPPDRTGRAYVHELPLEVVPGHLDRVLRDDELVLWFRTHKAYLPRAACVVVDHLAQARRTTFGALVDALGRVVTPALLEHLEDLGWLTIGRRLAIGGRLTIAGQLAHERPAR